MPKILTGKVISTKMNKTVVVSVERTYKHLLYKKIIKKNKSYKAHNEEQELHDGDVVRIRETRPISKTKHFEVIKKIS